MAMGYKTRSRGSLIPIATVIALVSFIVLTSISYLVVVYSRQTNVHVWRDRLVRLANEGYIESLAKINSAPSLSSFLVSGSNEWGIYSATATVVLDLPNSIPNSVETVPELEHSIYLVITATLTAPTAPAPKSVEVRCYIGVADAARYFAAFRNRGGISRYANMPNADIYARDLILVSSANVERPRVGKIYYVNSVTHKDVFYPFPNNPTSLSPNVEYTSFVTSDASANKGKVNQMSSEPTFPQVSPAYMSYLKQVATSPSGPNSYFSGNATFPLDIQARGWATGNDIYPPGCTTADCASAGNDVWKNHVYYVNGNLSIKGKVHGQIIFVASGVITINGDLVSDSLSYPSGSLDSPATPYPGCPSPCYADKKMNVGHEEASNAHQAVLITPSAIGIKINNTITCDTTIVPPPAGYPVTPPTLSVEAYLLAPNGSSTVTSATSGNILGFDFKGALIMSDNVNWSGYLVYPAGLGSNYMSSLSSRPPPYLPSFTKLQIWDEVYH